MRRPGPLRDLPLELFLPPNPSNPNIPATAKHSSFRPNNLKRPLSPGTAPSLFSPTKRRILAEEGIFSPQKTLKSPIRSPIFHAYGTFCNADSPARKLDFGVPKDQTAHDTPTSSRASSSQSTASLTAVEVATPKSMPITNKLAPSPEFASKKSSPVSFSGIDDDDDYFSPRRPPTMIPRELPPPPDRYSAHYPGFDIFLDTHIPLLRSSSLSSSESEANGLSSDGERDAHKENVPPRRRSRKAATAPEPTKHGLLMSPEAKKRETEKAGKWSAPATPKKRLSGERERELTATPTPRRPTHSTPGAGLTPAEKRARRRMLEEEVDEADEEML